MEFLTLTLTLTLTRRSLTLTLTLTRNTAGGIVVQKKENPGICPNGGSFFEDPETGTLGTCRFCLLKLGKIS